MVNCERCGHFKVCEQAKNHIVYLKNGKLSFSDSDCKFYIEGKKEPIAKVEIPLKLPSLNEYTGACRENKYKGARMKKDIENNIAVFLKKLPRFEKPVAIDFHWIEENKRRDLDNICSAKKFILDALVKLGKLKDDNRKCVYAFKDTFGYGLTAKVILSFYEKEGKL